MRPRVILSALSVLLVGAFLAFLLSQRSEQAGGARDDGHPPVVAAATPGTTSTQVPANTGARQSETRNGNSGDEATVVVPASFGPPAAGKYRYEFKGGPRVGIDEVDLVGEGDVKVSLGDEEEQRGYRYTYSWGSARVDQIIWDQEDRGEREECSWDPPLPTLIFPLEVGKTWDYSGTCSFKHIFFDLESRSEVLGVEAIEIMGRTVPTWIVRTTWIRVLGQHHTCCPPVPSPNSSVEGDDRFWWSPEFGVPVWEISQRVTKTDAKEEEFGWVRFLADIDYSDV